MDLQNLITEYYNSTQTMQLATVINDQPWICTVTFTSDENLRLYWVSNTNRRHSEEIIQNPNVAVAIVKSTDPKQALQITGTARQLSNEEAIQAHAYYEQKLGVKPGLLDVVQKQVPNGPAYWAVEPTTISLWDEHNFPDSPKQEYNPTT